MRLIDADELTVKLKRLLKDFAKAPTKQYVIRIIISMLGDKTQTPTIDAEPVVHAYWIENRDRSELQLICNQCGYDYIEADPDCKERHNFCPHCGAEMDEEAEQ